MKPKLAQFFLALLLLNQGSDICQAQPSEFKIAGLSITTVDSEPHPANLQNPLGKLTVSRADAKLFEIQGGRFSIPEDLNDATGHLVARNGQDLTGDTTADVIVYEHLASRNCCLNIYLLELGTKPRIVGKIDSRFDLSPTYYRAQSSKAIGIHTKDYTFGGWGSSDFSVPAPRIFVLLGRSGLRLDSKKMKEAPQSLAVMQDRAAVVRADLEKTESTHRAQDLPQSLISSVLGLIYGGNSDRVSVFLDLSWPPGRPGKELFWSDVLATLKKSPYAKDLALADVYPQSTKK